MWKATDGIAETTWPGVYNRSRLPGRNDYLTLPDWNTYVEGGKALTLTLPKEPWNHLEIQGAAYGELTYAPPGAASTDLGGKLATRAKDQERTFNQFTDERTGGVLTFSNIAQETPIQEIAAYDLGWRRGRRARRSSPTPSTPTPPRTRRTSTRSTASSPGAIRRRSAPRSSPCPTARRHGRARRKGDPNSRWCTS